MRLGRFRGAEDLYRQELCYGCPPGTKPRFELCNYCSCMLLHRFLDINASLYYIWARVYAGKLMYCFLKVLGFSIGWRTVKRHDFIALQLESDDHLLSTTRDCERCINSR